MKQLFGYIKKNKFLLLIILPAFFLYMLVIFPSGSYYCFKEECGYYFWGVHGHDAIWHLAIANVSFNKFPFVSPTYVGENLYGYNYLLDFIIFLLTKVGIPASFSYFKLLPIAWFILFTFLLIILARKIKDSPSFVYLFLFFNYFAGSFSYLLTFIHHRTVNGSSSLLPQPIMHMMSNLPYAFSLLPLLIILILLKDKIIDLKKIFLIGISIFLIMGLKFYGGVISIFLVLTHVILASVARPESSLDSGVVPIKSGLPRMTKRLAIISIFVILGIFLFYDPIRSLKTGSIFGFAPFALIHPITEQPNLFYLQDMTDARYFLQAAKKIGPRLIAIETLNLTLFLFFYLGTRFFGLLYVIILFLKRKLEKFDAIIIPTILFSILLTTLFVQKAEWWNTIQFFFYAIFLSTIYLTKLIYEAINTKKKVIIIGAFVIITLSIPTSLDLVREFFVFPGATYLPREEIEALNFLKKQPEGVVLAHLYDEKWKNLENPTPIFAYADNAYISAFSGKQVYLSDILQLRLTGVPYLSRLEKMKKMDCSIFDEVNYVYEIRRLPNEKKMTDKCKQKNVKKIYSNGSILIYTITK